MADFPDSPPIDSPDVGQPTSRPPGAAGEETAVAPGGRLRTAQAYLAALGYRIAGRRDPAGAMDGILGHGTRGAIEQFQADQGMEKTGQLDPDTWEALVDAHQEAVEVESSAPTSDEGDPVLGTEEARALAANLPSAGPLADEVELPLPSDEEGPPDA